ATLGTHPVRPPPSFGLKRRCTQRPALPHARRQTMATTPKPTRPDPLPTLPMPDTLATAAGDDDNEPLDEDFHFVLGELLAAYKPVLAADLQRAESPDALIKDALANPPSCEDEFTQAFALFERFSNEEVAQRLLPAEMRAVLGPIE